MSRTNFLGFILAVFSFSSAHAISFRKDVSPILNAKCVSCHNQDWSGMNLRDYETVSNLSDKIKRVVLKRIMPPAGITPLTEKERIVIYVWIKQGKQP